MPRLDRNLRCDTVFIAQFLYFSGKPFGNFFQIIINRLIVVSDAGTVWAISER